MSTDLSLGQSSSYKSLLDSHGRSLTAGSSPNIDIRSKQGASHKSLLKREAMTMKSVALFLLGLVAGTNAIELTPDNWDTETAGKTVFIKFLAPW